VSWTVRLSSKVPKQIEAIPAAVKARLFALIKEIELLGPVRGTWKNYGKLSDSKHHCHIKSGRPTYVACWEVTHKEIRIIEVYYVGSHEKAPY